MRQIKLNKNNVVVSIVKSSKSLDGYILNEDETVVIGSKLNEDGTFTSPTVVYNIEEHKQQLEQRLHDMAERTIQLTQRKYRLTDATGTATIIRMEYNAWRLDNSTPTPIIDSWATDKGKTREEQLQAVGYIVTFLEKSAKIQELAWSRTDSATTKKQLGTINSALDIVANCESVLCTKTTISYRPIF